MALPINEIKTIKQFCESQFDCSDCPFRKGLKITDLACYIGYPINWALEDWDKSFNRKAK